MNPFTTKGSRGGVLRRQWLALIALLPLLLCGAAGAEPGLIQRRPVESSDLASVGYDARKRRLEIEFRSGGIYRYFEVPAEVHGQLLAAESKGRFFAKYIRNRFRFERVNAHSSAAR